MQKNFSSIGAFIHPGILHPGMYQIRDSRIPMTTNTTTQKSQLINDASNGPYPTMRSNGRRQTGRSYRSPDSLPHGEILDGSGHHGASLCLGTRTPTTLVNETVEHAHAS